MSKTRNYSKNLLMLSGGPNSSSYALWLLQNAVEFDCLHFRDTSTAGNIAFEAAQADASRCAGKFHVRDVSSLRDFLSPGQDQPLLEFPYHEEGADPTSLILMLGLAAKFARNHGYGTIYMGIPSGDVGEVERFMEIWERLLWSYETTDPQYGHYVNPTLHFVTFDPDVMHAIEATEQAA